MPAIVDLFRDWTVHPQEFEFADQLQTLRSRSSTEKSAPTSTLHFYHRPRTRLDKIFFACLRLPYYHFPGSRSLATSVARQASLRLVSSGQCVVHSVDAGSRATGTVYEQAKDLKPP